MRYRYVDTGFRDLSAADTSGDLNVPLTDAMLMFELKKVIPAALLRAPVGLKVRLGVQFSNNPLEFTDTPKELLSSYWTSAGWNRSDTQVDLFSLAATTPRMYGRFVALTQTTSGTLSSSAQCRMRLAVIPIRALRLVSGFRKVNTKGSDTNTATHPMTEAVEILGFTEQRVMVEIAGITGALKVTVLYQETNTPDDPTSWADVATIGSELTAAGVTFPTTFSATAFAKRYGRWCVKLKNDTGGTDIESCLASIVVEIRE